jgi:hypothetical protein
MTPYELGRTEARRDAGFTLEPRQPDKTRGVSPSGPVTPYELGRAEARRDVAAGFLMLKSYGLASPRSRKYTKTLRTPVEIPVQAVAGCVVTEDLVERVRGYNEVMEAEIQRRIANGTLDGAVKGTNS